MYFLTAPCYNGLERIAEFEMRGVVFRGLASFSLAALDLEDVIMKSNRLILFDFRSYEVDRPSGSIPLN